MEDQTERVRAAATRVQELEAELEASSDATVGADAVAEARALLHLWVDTVTGVVVAAANGRVSLIHANGRESRITSPDLPYLLSKPVGRKTDA